MEQALPREGRPQAAMVILVGAVTKGAFEAGVLKVLAEREIPVRRIVASSSGALNGVPYAAGVRARREKSVAEMLVRLWEHRAGLCDVLDVHLGDIVRGAGLSRQGKLLTLLRDSVRPSGIPDPAPIDLDIVVAPLNGVTGSVGDQPATTYTKILSYPGAYFDRKDLLEQVFAAAVASAALPGLFVPVEVRGIGPCVDGGLISETLTRAGYCNIAEAIDAVFVVASTSAHIDSPRRTWRGGALLTHVIDMLFSEGHYHLMREIVAMNETLQSLEEIARRRRLDRGSMAEIKAALGWRGRHIIPLVTIRPTAPLPGDIFSGFFSGSMRRRYIEIGIERATEVLDELGFCRDRGVRPA